MKIQAHKVFLSGISYHSEVFFSGKWGIAHHPEIREIIKNLQIIMEESMSYECTICKFSSVIEDNLNNHVKLTWKENNSD